MMNACLLLHLGQMSTSKAFERQFGLGELVRRHPVLLSAALHAVLIAYGEYQDRNFTVKYTDVDYRVFSDAVNLLWRGGEDESLRAKGWLTKAMGWTIGDPYERATFRYTPLLPILLSPIHYQPLLGKVILSVFSLSLPSLLLSPPLSSPPFATHLIWSLNPMVLNITTRGSSEAILSVIIVGALSLFLKGRESLAAVVWAFAVHWKVYPIVYVTSLWASLAAGGWFGIRVWRFAAVSAMTFAALTFACWSIWGYNFIHHTYLHHLTRQDHRHNFSPYFYPIYLSRFPSAVATASILETFVRHPLTSFLPQASLTLLAGLWLPRKGVHVSFVWFVQTFIFVAFNKVCTSQYFIWFLFLLPPALPYLKMTRRKALITGGLWVLGQVLWLAIAFHLEFKAYQVYQHLWAAGCLFVIIQAYVVGALLDAYESLAGRTTSGAGKKS